MRRFSTAVVLTFAAACSDGQHSPRDGWLPNDFVLGAGYSPYQTEGNSTQNDFDVWNRAGHGKDLNGQADDSYDLYETDAQLASDLGARAFRLGIEWSRVEPEPGVWDEQQIAHYRAVLESIRARGITPYVTLWHFTNPLWFAEQGAWLWDGAPDAFATYAGEMARRFGDLVDQWITLNEPMIYASGTYLASVFPGGGLLQMGKTEKALTHLIFAHAQAFDAIRAADTVDADGDGRASVIAFVNATSPYVALDPSSAADVAAALAWDWAANRLFFEAVVHGNLDVNLDGRFDDTTTDPPEGFHPELANRLDYIGINYYTRNPVLRVPLLVEPLGGAPCISVIAELLCNLPNDVPRGTNGSEVYPQGLYDDIVELSSFGLPMMITENGVATEDGSFRARYLIEHLDELLRAIADGYDVRGYLHWSLIDNFEWLDGFSQRFGLYSVDYATFGRTLNQGGAAFRDIASARRISPEIRARYGG